MRVRQMRLAGLPASCRQLQARSLAPELKLPAKI